MTNKEMVAVTGIGVLSPIGVTVAEVAESLKILRSGIRRIEAPPLRRAYPAGVVDLETEPFFPRLDAVYLDRCQQLAALAGRDALADAGLDRLDALGARAGLYYGNVNGGSTRAQADYCQLLCNAQQATSPFSIIAVMHNSGAAYLSIRHGIAGPVHTHGSACASSGAAIGEAARAIRDGHIDVALAGGAEAPLSAAILGGFEGGVRAGSPGPMQRRWMPPTWRNPAGRSAARARVWYWARALPFSCSNRRRMPGCATHAVWHGCRAMAWHPIATIWPCPTRQARRRPCGRRCRMLNWNRHRSII